MIYTETDAHGTVFRLSVAAELVREAQSVMVQFSRPAQEFIAKNMYGPREARFAAVVVQAAADVEKLCVTERRETERLEAQVAHLSKLLNEAATLIEEHVVGFPNRIEAFRTAAGEYEPPEDAPEDAVTTIGSEVQP